MSLKMSEERDGDVLVLLPVGRVDGTNDYLFESLVMQRIGDAEGHVIVDFSRLDFISSAGLRVLLLAAKTLEAERRTFVLCAMKSHIREIFRINGFDRIIPMEESRASAVAASG
ncbi:MAG: STAS domain-containing protein [Acidobacteria bacterium]|nr:STAS domain-containing protein [Acidobacteriota bacterium]MXZ70649.1 STAS domain-containing protein [Acidobacteriota bacterium]MYD70015.1 STAS domain-containing protein [Acidobacteriota bacterium]MYJ05409.1 STAS domain-containing protein [Acidobacteriota bacterium]